MPMSPGEVRKRVLDEHRRLRSNIDYLRPLVDEVLSGDESRATLFADGCRDFLVRLSQHLDHEDRILVPTLRVIDAWGDVRATRVEEDHRRQRITIRETLGYIAEANRPLREMATTMQAFIRILEADMAEEDSDVLDPRLLRDDTIEEDAFSG